MKSILIFLLLTLSCINLQAQWNPVNSGSSEPLYDIFFINDQVGYAVGGGGPYGYPLQNSNGVILKTTDSGQNWNVVFNQPILAIYAVVVVNNIVQSYGRNQNGPVSIKSTDHGQNWTSTQLTYFPQEVKSSGNIIYFMMGGFTTTLKKIQNGAVSIVASDVGKYGVTDNELIYVNGHYNTIYKSTDYGNTFSPLNGYPIGGSGIGFGQNQSTNAVIKSFGDTIIVHYTYPSATQFSIDNSDSWTRIPGGPPDYCSIISDNLLIANLDNSIYYQLDFASWNLQATLSDEIRKIYIYSDNLGFAIGDNGMIYKTTNVVGLGTANPKLETKINLYPNPSQEQLCVELSEGIEIQSFKIFNLQGRQISISPPSQTGNNFVLDIRSLATGEYFLQIQSNKGKTTKKILIK